MPERVLYEQSFFEIKDLTLIIRCATSRLSFHLLLFSHFFLFRFCLFVCFSEFCHSVLSMFWETTSLEELVKSDGRIQTVFDILSTLEKRNSAKF